MTNTNLFERKGWGLWGELRTHIGQPLPVSLAKAPPATTHSYRKCPAPSTCVEHRRSYRRDLQHRRDAEAKAAVLAANRDAFRRIAAAGHPTRLA